LSAKSAGKLTFMMGSPSSETGGGSDEKEHKVTLTKGFYIGVTEVTQGLWKAVMGSNPSHFKNCGDNCPMEQVSWNDCKDFIRKLNRMVPGGGFRLPTEAEWEYAARAGTSTRFCFGNNDNWLGQYAWYSSNSGSKTHAVGQKRPNSWGLYDMHGNVWEWCEDIYSEDAYNNHQSKNPIYTSGGSDRVIRGGSCGSGPRSVRCADRDSFPPGDRRSYLGFRLVRPVK